MSWGVNNNAVCCDLSLMLGGPAGLMMVTVFCVVSRRLGARAWDPANYFLSRQVRKSGYHGNIYRSTVNASVSLP